MKNKQGCHDIPLFVKKERRKLVFYIEEIVERKKERERMSQRGR